MAPVSIYLLTFQMFEGDRHNVVREFPTIQAAKEAAKKLSDINTHRFHIWKKTTATLSSKVDA